MLVVFDCESDCSFLECAGTSHDDKICHMRATVVCALEISDEVPTKHTEHTFWVDDERDDGDSAPFERLFTLFDKADVIVAYNGLDFDLPLLRKHYKNFVRYVDHRSKVLDPFANIRSVTGRWVKLDELLKKNGLAAKSGDGLMAINLWRDGSQEARDKLEEYCRGDVRQLYELIGLSSIKMPSTQGPSITLPRRVFAPPQRCQCCHEAVMVGEEPFVVVEH